MRNIITILIAMAVIALAGTSDYEAELKTQQIDNLIMEVNTGSR
jgi:hypothetical protein